MSRDTAQRPADPQMIAVFDLGVGAGSVVPGALRRHITDAIADALSSFPGVLARPIHLARPPARPLDPNLIDDPEADAQNPPAADRVRFILYNTLPMDGLLRRLTLERGCQVALTGRLGLDRQHVALALNLWEVVTPNLWACRAATGDLDDLPAILAELIGDIAWGLQPLGALARSDASAQAARSLGTRSTPAFEALAAATDKLRRLDADPTPDRLLPILQALTQALRHDPAFEAPRLILTDIALERLEAGDDAFCEAMLKTLPTIETQDLVIYDLLIFEALLRVRGSGEAARHLERAAARFPAAPALARARARLAPDPA